MTQWLIYFVTTLFFPLSSTCSNRDNFMKEFYFWFSLLFVLVRILTMMLSAGVVHDEVKQIMSTMYEIPTKFWCLEVSKMCVCSYCPRMYAFSCLYICFSSFYLCIRSISNIFQYPLYIFGKLHLSPVVLLPRSILGIFVHTVHKSYNGFDLLSFIFKSLTGKLNFYY